MNRPAVVGPPASGVAEQSPVSRASSGGTRAPLRLLMATPRFLPDVGGVENHVYEVARRLADAGVLVTVLTTDRTGRLPSTEDMGPVHVRRVRAWPRAADYYFAPGIYRAIRQADWDVIHIQSYHTLVPPLAMLGALRSRTPYVVTFHGGGHSSRLRNAMRGAQQRLLRPFLARAERLVAVAEFEIADFGQRLNLPAERFVLIPNGSDLPPVPEGSTSNAAAARPLIASIGRLERYKGHHRVIAALPGIVAHYPEARLWIAGTGPYEEALRTLARELGVEAHVDIHAIPPTERRRMAEAIAEVDLVTLLSERETHPIAVLESLSLGRSVLVADAPGLRELAAQGLARSVPLGSSSDELAAAVIDQLQRPLKPARLSLQSWDQTAAQLLSLYEQVRSQ